MRGLLLFSQRTFQLKQDNSLIKKNITDRKTMQNASTSNATKFKEKRITLSRDTCVWSFNAALRKNLFCEGWHLLLRRVTFLKLFNIYNHTFEIFTTSATHFTQHLCHSWNMCWNPFRIKHLKVVFAAPNATCRDSKQQPLRSLLPIGNRKNSEGVKSRL